MKKLTAGLLCAAALVAIGARYASEPGQEPYTPTRVEWLTTVCNAEGRRTTKLYNIWFTAVEPNTVQINLACTIVTGKPERDEAIKLATDLITEATKRHGWGDWVKIKVNVQEF